jgi:two-component system, chemotaxis family, CheB/CheR fusion protein
VPPETAGDERGVIGDSADEAALHDVLTFLRTRTGRDLSTYKRATLLRGIARRMQVNGTDQLSGYLVCLRTRPGEADALLQDILISVTNFFRDAECFDALDRHIPSLFEGKGPNDTLRVWVAACATGEEAYSVAMALSEHARTLEAPPLIQVFATDLSSEAIEAARAAMYPSTIETDVSKERLRRYFVKEHAGYRVRRELREMVLFAMHDVLKDSPFSRLDMVTCRNLLIYLSRDAQARVLDIFHFSLVPGGKLFLGASESIDDGSPLFKVLDKKNRIYQQQPTSRSALPVPTGAALMGLTLDARHALREGPVFAGRAFHMPNATLTPRPLSGHTSVSELHLKLLERIAPPSILVDREYDILHVSAGASRFLQVGAGEPTRNLLRMVHPDLRIELRAALFQASQSRQTVDVPPVAMEIGGEAMSISMRVDPAHDIGSDLFLVTLELQGPRPDSEPSEAAVARAGNDSVARHLDRELERLKTHLRETVEQFEASTEELKASNEELQAMNKELRSATEELETRASRAWLAATRASTAPVLGRHW